MLFKSRGGRSGARRGFFMRLGLAVGSAGGGWWGSVRIAALVTPAFCRLGGAACSGAVGVTVQELGGDDIERPQVGRIQDHWRGPPGTSGFQPACGAEAPAVASHQAWKIPLRSGGHQIVAGGNRIFQEIGRHHRADGMDAGIPRCRAAAAVAEEACQRGMGAGDERFAEDIAVAGRLANRFGAVKGNHGLPAVWPPDSWGVGTV